LSCYLEETENAVLLDDLAVLAAPASELGIDMLSRDYLENPAVQPFLDTSPPTESTSSGTPGVGQRPSRRPISSKSWTWADQPRAAKNGAGSLVPNRHGQPRLRRQPQLLHTRDPPPASHQRLLPAFRMD
jgi:hypothetical protein